MRVTGRPAAVLRTALCAAAVCLGAARAEAAQCSFSTSPVSFGVYNVFTSAPNDAVGTITYECNGGARNVVVAITVGSSGTFALRTLVRGAETLGYNLFRDAARTSVWGDGTSGSQPVYVGDPPNRTQQALPIYGRIPPGQDVSAGAYSDSISVVVLY